VPIATLRCHLLKVCDMLIELELELVCHYPPCHQSVFSIIVVRSIALLLGIFALVALVAFCASEQTFVSRC
jgi:hypothetical protein